MVEATEKNSQIKMTEAAKRYEELDRLAFDFVKVDTDVLKLGSLNFEEHAYVMSMAHLYALHRLGYLSASGCREVKKRRIKECQKIHNALMYTRHLQARWVLCTKVYYERHRELVELVKGRNPLALKKALELIDILSGQYIYSKLYAKTRAADVQTEMFEELIDETCDEYEYEGEREEIKALIARIIEEYESGNMCAVFEGMTEEEEKKILRSLPPKEQLTEEVLKELMPRTK